MVPAQLIFSLEHARRTAIVTAASVPAAKGRNAGWTAYVYYGYDEAKARDARRFGARGSRSDLFSGNLQYKWNSFVTFGYEQGLYRTSATDRFGALPLFRGIPSYTAHNIRSQFAAILSF